MVPNPTEVPVQYKVLSSVSLRFESDQPSAGPLHSRPTLQAMLLSLIHPGL